MFTGSGAASWLGAETFLAEAVHADDIISFTLVWDRPLQWPVVARAMETLLALRGSDILRAEGTVEYRRLCGPGGGAVRSASGASARRTADLPDGDRISRLVFITRNIAERICQSAVSRRWSVYAFLAAGKRS